MLAQQKLSKVCKKWNTLNDEDKKKLEKINMDLSLKSFNLGKMFWRKPTIISNILQIKKFRNSRYILTICRRNQRKNLEGYVITSISELYSVYDVLRKPKIAKRIGT